MVTEKSSTESPPPARRLTIELLALDLTTCSRCVGTDANIRSALPTRR